ncbi:MAG: PAS domain S-box protein [Ideonella sp.]|nr:PAS domain S-box protein [Ideonella sp.]
MGAGIGRATACWQAILRPAVMAHSPHESSAVPTINRQLFLNAASLRLRDVVLSASDDVQTHRDKLARIVLDEMYQFVGLLDTDGMTLEINRSALEGAALRLDDIQGKPFWAARWWSVSVETVDAVRAYILRAGQGEFVRCDVEVFGKAAGEETIVIDFSLLPVKDQDGKVVFLLAEGRNITEKKRAEAQIARKSEELQSLLDKLRQADQLKSDFFANISHELRTPLALILGPAEAMLSGGDKLTVLQRRDLNVIHRNAATLLNHVNDLLDLAKLDAGKMGLNHARIDLARAVRKVAEQFHAIAPQRPVSYVIDTPDTLHAEVDPEKIERVVLNLLSNAFKFTPVGGRIRLALEAGAGDSFVLSVQDTGPGVPSDMRRAIFERFRQAQGGTTRDVGGTGLGLAIAKEFVDLHQGTIGVSTAPGGGALFQVELPLHAPAGSYVRDVETMAEPDAEAAFVGDAIAVAQPGKIEDEAFEAADDRATILVVEDNAEMRRFITEVLASDYRVVTAADGEQALARAQTEPPDLVVTDLMMPRLGGDRLVAEMRRRPRLAQVPVLVLSAKGDEALRARLLAESVQDYVTKPFSAHELRARVRNLVMMKCARDALQRELATQNEDLSQLTRQLIANRQTLQRSMEALQESEHRWRALYEHSPVGIAMTDSAGQILATNPAFQTMLGYSREEFRNCSILKITPEEDHATVQARIARLVAGEIREYHLQRRYQRRDGQVVWANTSVSVLPATRSVPRMLVVVAEDITERKRAAEALVTAQNELARVARVSTLGELAASIAHEVNQPLAAVVANGHACLRWLDAQPPNADEVEAAVQRIVRDANQASQVIARIRGFLRRGEFLPTQVDVEEVIGEVIKLVQGEARAQGVSLRLMASHNVPAVVVDRVQLQQVILNLVMNAMEAMCTTDEAPRVVELSAHWNEADCAVLVEVRDTGLGIGAADRERIFEAFHTTKPAGMGMGLAISRSIVEAHGGRLWAAANQDRGETFRFTLPTDRT